MRFLSSAAVAALAFALTGGSPAQHVHEEHGQLGKVSFATSCDAKVQPEFQRAVAMLHSFWFTARREGVPRRARRTTRLRDRHLGHRRDPDGEPARRAGRLAARRAETAQAAIDKAAASARRPSASATTSRRSPPTTRTSPTAPSARARQRARKAFEALAAKYPDDDEAQIFYALYLAGTQSQADQTYAAYLKAAAILEKQFAKYPDHPGVAHYLIHSYDAPPIAAQGPARGAPLRRHRARRAARAAHALAHLHARRRLGGLGRRPTAARPTSRKKDGNGRRGATTPATTWCTPTCSSARDGDARRCSMECRRAGQRINPARSPAPMRVGGDAGALRARARRLARGGAAASRRPTQVPVHRGDHALRARARRGAQRRRRRRRAGGASSSSALHKALLDGEEQLLGDRGRGPAARRRGWIALAQGKTRRGAAPHARGRRPRGPQREAHRHARAASCPRASCSATCCSS